MASVGGSERLRLIEEAPDLQAVERLLSDHSRELHFRGYTVLDQMLDDVDVIFAHDETCQQFEALVTHIESNNVDVREETFAFREIIHRDRLRYDINKQATVQW